LTKLFLILQAFYIFPHFDVCHTSMSVTLRSVSQIQVYTSKWTTLQSVPFQAAPKWRK